MKHKFTNGSQGKINCPYCNGKKTFRTYEPVDGSEVLNEKGELCGICDRTNSCGVWIKPDGTMSENRKPAVHLPDPIILVLDNEQKEHLRLCLKNETSNFHTFCTGLGIPLSHLKKWGVGTEKDKTIFTFIDHERNPCNIKYFKYLENGKRDKEFKAYSLKSNMDGIQEYKYKICLFGEHLLSKDNSRFVCLVESEKTAIIASHYFPKYDFVSCASADGLTDLKAQILKDRFVIWLCDADKAGRENSSLRVLKRQRIKHKVIDLNPQLQDGTDLADMITGGNCPNLQKEILTRTYEDLDKRPYDSQIRKRNLTKYLFEKRKMEVMPNVFKNVITDKDLSNIQRLDGFMKIRVEKTEDVYDLEFLALIEEVIYKLKVAYHTAENFNRESWLMETLIRERKIKELKEGLDDALIKNATCQSVIHGLQMLAFKNATEMKSLQSNLITNVPTHSQRKTGSKESEAIRTPTRNGNSPVKTTKGQVLN
jgi:Domain of unknown function (DUF6371)